MQLRRVPGVCVFPTGSTAQRKDNARTSGGRTRMAAKKEAATGSHGGQTFYSAYAERLDRWRTLSRIARSWASADHSSHDDKSISDLRSIASDLLGQMETLESFFAYPGAKHMATARERLAEGDA